MKSQRGITLISLIVYVIVMLIVVTIVGTITSYFYANVNDQYQESKDENGENALDMYLANDLKNKQISIKTADFEEIHETGSKTINLLYKDNTSVIYTITDDGIYRNSVKVYNIGEENLVFALGEILASSDNSIIYEKQELRIEKIVEGKEEREIIKSYTVNVETKVIYNTQN